MIQYWAAFMIGLVGSFHCVGMCGPIAMAIPVGNGSWFDRILGTVVYNSGRIVTYALFGALFGFLGEGIQLAGFQQSVSIILGAAVLLFFGLPYLSNKYALTNDWLHAPIVKLKVVFGKVLKQRTKSSLLLLGLLNGLLPCGLVYLAVTGAIVAATSYQGAMYMALFGVGTLPFMLVLPLVGNFISLAIRNRIKSMVPVFVIVFATVFILRGLNLGIPYVSPQFSEDKTEVKSCCHAPKVECKKTD